MGFSRQEYWSGLPFPSPGDLSDPGIEPGSLALQADALPSEPPGKLEKRDFPDPEMNLGHGGESAEAWPLDLNPVLPDSLRPPDCSLLDSSVLGTLQARILDYVAIPFARRSSLSWD